MSRTVNWVARTLGFAWLGVLAFAIAPVSGSGALVAQYVSYGLAPWACSGWRWRISIPR